LLNRAIEQIVGRERRGRFSQLAWCGEGCFDSRRRVNSDVGLLFSHMLKLAAVLFIALPITAGCNHPRVASKSSSPQSDPVQEATPKSHDITDPSCCGLSADANRGIDSAWESFTKNGHYRMALERDMRYSSAARDVIARSEPSSEWNPLNHLFAYSWGHRGYDTDQDLLAAIVVDTSRNDDARFGLVIFAKPKRATYHPYWLYQNRNLSRAVVYQVSGALGVSDYHDDGTYDNCWVTWSARQNTFICR
jgi:hypothetical protein